jgi:1,4-alpha-glucan branching enzyme
VPAASRRPAVPALRGYAHFAVTPKPTTPARESAPGAGLPAIVQADPYLLPHAPVIAARLEQFRTVYGRLAAIGGTLRGFARGHHHFGFTRGTHDGTPGGTPGIWYREWAPGAHALSLVGDFNFWNRDANPLRRDHWGVWSLFLPDTDGRPALPHGAPVKVHVRSAAGTEDRLPAYSRYVTFQPDGSGATARVWLPPAFAWQHPLPAGPQRSLRIYEAHVGMAQEEAKVGTFAEFRERILPRIAAAGYTAIQLMAVAEHPYYGSFGYHVSNFFAVSSRFGTPEDFKALVDAAHGLGLCVLLDLVHSHAVKNTVEGLGGLDGTDHQYFHAGPRGRHPAWDSLLFDYSQTEVLRFLLSNVAYWLEEFRVDGFRFDGVTSMLYRDHGLGRVFSGYGEYFGGNIDPDALTYLQLANTLAHEIRPDAITIAEDVSGMPGTARPVAEGGLGFDYRLAMGIPDHWIKLIKEQRDEDWRLGHIFHVLSDRRATEAHVAYAESHDQALVGDKTLAFRLMDAEMYWNMSRLTTSLVVDRGVALHKIIRLLTFALGGSAWLNFMGNEFGHPEWVDFPREGNGFSYQHARRQWSLADADHLRYKDLAAFDRALMALDDRFGLLSAPPATHLRTDEARRELAFDRAGLVFAFNLHPDQSRTDWRIGVPAACDYAAVLTTDEPRFGGHGRAVPGTPSHFPWSPGEYDRQRQSVSVYLPARSAVVLAPTGPRSG